MDAKEIQKLASDLFNDIPEKTKVKVTLGKGIDLSSLKIRKHAPKSDKFRVYNFINPSSKRRV